MNLVVGTAGHVDHGKSSLVLALTGTDPDRLAEEKRRGMTIELGFAAWTLPSGGRVGVVDVPGHQRFVRTMVAGAQGIDLVLLVVAADEGVMPQTREHLAICGLLGARNGGLERHGERLERADPGGRTAVNLAGVERAQLGRGMALVLPAAMAPTQRLDTWLEALDDAPAGIRHNATVAVHLGTAEVAD